jgi:hypothetical protein
VFRRSRIGARFLWADNIDTLRPGESIAAFFAVAICAFISFAICQPLISRRNTTIGMTWPETVRDAATGSQYIRPFGGTNTADFLRHPALPVFNLAATFFFP